MSAAVGVVLVTFAALACLGGGAWVIRRAYRGPRLPLVVAGGLLAGAAVFGIALVVSGLRHFGGHVTVSGGRTGGYACAQWWMQIDTRYGLTNDHATPSPGCRQAAVNAADAVLLPSALVGAAWAVLVGGFLAVRMRAADQRPGRPCK
jgi:hypothetical protein